VLQPVALGRTQADVTKPIAVAAQVLSVPAIECVASSGTADEKKPVDESENHKIKTNQDTEMGLARDLLPLDSKYEVREKQ